VAAEHLVGYVLEEVEGENQEIQQRSTLFWDAGGCGEGCWSKIDRNQALILLTFLHCRVRDHGHALCRVGVCHLGWPGEQRHSDGAADDLGGHVRDYEEHFEVDFDMNLVFGEPHSLHFSGLEPSA